jgi:hypothetical protein
MLSTHLQLPPLPSPTAATAATATATAATTTAIAATAAAAARWSHKHTVPLPISCPNTFKVHISSCWVVPDLNAVFVKVEGMALHKKQEKQQLLATCLKMGGLTMFPIATPLS